MKKRSTPVVFLDRDGTLNELVYRSNYNEYCPPWFADEVKLKRGAISALNRLLSAKFNLVVVTNQPDAAKNRASLDQLNAVKTRFITLLEQEGIYLSGYFNCVHHPKGIVPKLSCICDCRKPKIGMFSLYSNVVNVDKARSWMIGDSISDIQAGSKFGVGTIGLPSMDTNKLISNKDACVNAKNISQAVDFIIENYKQSSWRNKHVTEN